MHYFITLCRRLFIPTSSWVMFALPIISKKDNGILYDFAFRRSCFGVRTHTFLLFSTIAFLCKTFSIQKWILKATVHTTTKKNWVSSNKVSRVAIFSHNFGSKQAMPKLSVLINYRRRINSRSKCNFLIRSFEIL